MEGAKIITTIGFPHGASVLRSKTIEAAYAHQYSCDEADMVMNIGEFKSKKFRSVENEISAIKNVLNNITSTGKDKNEDSVLLPSGESSFILIGIL